MKITEITYSCGRTLQIKQFEPINVHFSAKAEVEAGAEYMSHVYQQLKNLVDGEVEKKINELTAPPVENCPDCGGPLKERKNGNGSYCSKKYPLQNPSCPPKEHTPEDIRILNELDNTPAPNWNKR